MATRNAARRAESPARITVAGMAADLYGSADERPPLVLLPGLTFDRRIWQPVLDHLPGSTQAGRYCPWTCPVMASHQTSYRTQCRTSSG